MTEFVSGEGLVVVGVIVGVAQICMIAKIKGVLVGDAEHWADDGNASEWAGVVDASEPSWARASGQVHEHGFELVVGVVARCDIVEILFNGDFFEGVVAGGAGVVLGVAGLISNVDRSFNELAPEIVCKFGGRVLIQFGQFWGAEIVDDVGDDWFGGHECQDGGESHGICPTGASDEGLAVVISNIEPAGELSPTAQDWRNSWVRAGQI